MKAQLMLEVIGWGHNSNHKHRPWVAMIERMARPFVAEIVEPREKHHLYGMRYLPKQNNDYREANRKGSRGVRWVFILESGPLYRVQEMTGCNKSRRYFCRVAEDDGEIIEYDEKETMAWIRQQYAKNHSGSTS